MWLKKFCKVLGCAAMVCCLSVTAWASDGTVLLEMLERNTPDIIEPADFSSGTIARVTGAVRTTISANSVKAVGDDLSLDAGETVTFDCTYSPASASMDFGLVAPDGYFYSINVTTGSINKTIQVSTRGTYTVAIRNNSSSAVTVTGTARY